MRNVISALTVAILLGLAPVGAIAAPFEDPDILLAGNDYSAVNDPTRWFTMADGSVYTPWANQWIQYTAYLTPGNWNIGLNVINLGNLWDGWDFQFNVFNGLTNTVFTIPGSSTQVFNGYFNMDVASAGYYTVRYTWLNDRYLRDGGVTYDANIRIVSAFFDDPPAASVPEPATLSLLAAGLLGLGLLRRSRRS